jgi:hypothetical protein
MSEQIVKSEYKRNEGTTRKKERKTKDELSQVEEEEEKE